MNELASCDAAWLSRTKPAECPSCRCDRGGDYEQQVCIDLFGECLICRFMPDGFGSGRGTPDDFVAIDHECWRRWRLQHGASA